MLLTIGRFKPEGNFLFTAIFFIFINKPTAVKPYSYLFLLTVFASAGRLNAQDYLIRHDMLSEKTSYLKILNRSDTAAVKDVVFRRQGKLMVDVENFNPHYWKVKATAIKKLEGDEANSSGLFNPFSILTQGLGGMVKSVIPGLDLAPITSRGGPATANDQGIDGYFYWVGEYQALFKRFREKISLAAELEILKSRLEELKYDITKPAAVIKQNARQAVIDVIGTDALDFDTILSLGRLHETDFRNITDSLGIISGKLNGLAAKVDKKEALQGMTVAQMETQVQRGNELFKQANADPDFLTLIAEVGKLYTEIRTTSFHYTYFVNNGGTIEQLRLQFYSRKDSMTADTITRYFPVKSNGYLRMRNSVGIAFSFFRENNTSYFVRPDTTIGSGKADFFTPVISTFIHFYPYKAGNWKIGGAVGFGLPVTGDKRDINYMLGLTAIIGKNEPIMLSLGAAGAKVKTLAGGWQVGRKVPKPDFNLPVFDVFRVGFFFSVSFNLGKMNITSRRND